MASKKDKNDKQDNNKNEQTNAQQDHNVRASDEQELNVTTADEQHYVEVDKPEPSDKIRAGATPEDEQLPGTLDNLPEPNSVGMLEHFVNPDPVAEAEKQQAENYPRASSEVFDPQNHVVEDARYGTASTHRSLYGRVLVVDEDVLLDSGEVVKAGVGDYGTEIADELLSKGVAFEPAGKKRGR